MRVHHYTTLLEVADVQKFSVSFEFPHTKTDFKDNILHTFDTHDFVLTSV